MSWAVFKQPDESFAIWSTISAGWVWTDLAEAEAWGVLICRSGVDFAQTLMDYARGAKLPDLYPVPDHPVGWKGELRLGSRVRQMADGSTFVPGVVEAFVSGQAGIRWDDHEARSFEPDQLDLFGQAAAERLLALVPPYGEEKEEGP